MVDHFMSVRLNISGSLRLIKWINHGSHSSIGISRRQEKLKSKLKRLMNVIVFRPSEIRPPSLKCKKSTERHGSLLFSLDRWPGQYLIWPSDQKHLRSMGKCDDGRHPHRNQNKSLGQVTQLATIYEKFISPGYFPRLQKYRVQLQAFKYWSRK